MGHVIDSVSEGVAHASGLPFLANAIQIIEGVDPIMDHQRLALNNQQVRALQNIQAAQVVHTPAGAGSVPGVWLRREDAEEMGVVPRLAPSYAIRPIFDAGFDFDAPIKTQKAYNDVSDKNTILNKLVERRILQKQTDRNNYRKKI